MALIIFRHLFKSNSFQNIRYYSELKSYLSQFPKTHSQKDCEKFWSEFWSKNKLFSFKTQNNDSAEVYSLLLPPPNITGSLHLGHALTVSIQDSLSRYHRMKGRSVVWIPGTDHAGIATQLMVEKLLWAEEMKTRYDLTRQQFLNKVNNWKDLKSNEIRGQLLRLGVSLDFDQEFFTLDKAMSEAVNEAFVTLFDSGHIYRSSLMVNWSFFLQSTISDIEVEHKQISGPTLLTVPGLEDKVLVGVMHQFNYPLEESLAQHITIATTRLETILGDVAIAVHPDDERYAHLIGKRVVHPLSGEKLPIISDTTVRSEFGTGALKITPSHSTVDYSIAKTHSLPLNDIFDDFGKINCPDLPLFHGIHRLKAKDIILEELKNKGLYVGHSDHKHSIPICSRSGDIVESRLVPQWFLKCDTSRVLTEFAVNNDYMNKKDEMIWNEHKVANEDRMHLTLIPPYCRNKWRDWFSRYEDWCISRQIYWGHQIPAYNVIKGGQSTESWVAAKSEVEALSKARKMFDSNDIAVKQDSDVFDTWFSSALLPLTVNGWPQQTELKHFPLSLMETGHDIIFFWVARMALMSYSLVGRLPFNRVLFHGMVCDSEGKKMSKSKGNVIDPIDVINGISMKRMKEKNVESFKSGLISEERLDSLLKGIGVKFPNGLPECGADALRLTLLQQDFKQENVYFKAEHVIENRKFCNKMHQTVNFLLTHIDNDLKIIDSFDNDSKLSNIDRWILSRLVEVIKNCNNAFVSYDLQKATHGLKHFWVNELCDIYLEHIKHIIHDKNNELRDIVLNILLKSIQTSLRAMHPFMPFITENLYQHIENKLNYQTIDPSFKSICDANYPDLSCDHFMIQFDHEIDKEINCANAIIKRIRWFKQHFNIPKDVLDNVLIAVNSNTLYKYKTFISSLSKVNQIEFIDLHNIYQYSNHFCFKIDESDGKIVEDNENIDEIFVIFGISYESIFEFISKSNSKPEVNEIKANELKENEIKNIKKMKINKLIV